MEFKEAKKIEAEKIEKNFRNGPFQEYKDKCKDIKGEFSIDDAGFEIFQGPILNYNPIMIIGFNPGYGKKAGPAQKNLEHRIYYNIHSIYDTFLEKRIKGDYTYFARNLRRYFCFIFLNEEQANYKHTCINRQYLKERKSHEIDSSAQFMDYCMSCPPVVQSRKWFKLEKNEISIPFKILASVFATNLIFFKSPVEERLHNLELALQLSRSILIELINKANPKLIITFGNEVEDELEKLQKEKKIREDIKICRLNNPSTDRSGELTEPDNIERLKKLRNFIKEQIQKSSEFRQEIDFILYKNKLEKLEELLKVS